MIELETLPLVISLWEWRQVKAVDMSRRWTSRTQQKSNRRDTGSRVLCVRAIISADDNSEKDSELLIWMCDTNKAGRGEAVAISAGYQ